mmetsp:Transcript_56513/g.126257  ORF Transcript_56513/g.126257 Transcript_56513/m.126257 type:complete len:465 (-) Transcript_56513:122-1516(-)
MRFDCSGRSAVVPNLFACGAPPDLHGIPFVYVHLPKASGSSAERLLQMWRNDTSRRSGALVLQRFPFPYGKSILFAGRGLYLGKRSALAERRIVGPKMMATMLREPAERILSHFYYLRDVSRRRWRHSFYPGACTLMGPHRNMSFADWYLQFHRHIPDINNFEVRLLVTETEHEDIIHSTESSVQVNHHCEWSHLPQVTGAHVRSAMRRLRAMSLIGLTDAFEESMRMWEKALPGFVYHNVRVCGNPKHNTCTRSHHRQLPPHLLQRIRKDNWGSYMLWSAAQRLFAQQEEHARSARLTVTRGARSPGAVRILPFQPVARALGWLRALSSAVGWWGGSPSPPQQSLDAVDLIEQQQSMLASTLRSVAQSKALRHAGQHGRCGTHPKTDLAAAAVCGPSGFGASRNKVTTTAACVSRCLACRECRYVSFSRQTDDCSLYHSCNLSSLASGYGYQTVDVVLRGRHR